MRLLTVVLLLTSLAGAQDPAAVVADLARVESAAQKVAQACQEATVALKAGPGHGSGVIVTRDGFVLTAAHCFREPGMAVTVVLHDGREVKARTLGREELHDFGLVKIVEKGEWPHAEMGRSSDVPKSAFCLATGNPWGIHRPAPLRLGTIIKTDQHSGRFIRSTCKVAPGDSGGPLWDLEGRVIGIHSFISPSVRHNYHVPVDRYRDNWDRLLKGDQWNLRPKPKRPSSQPGEEKPDNPPKIERPPDRGACDFGIAVVDVRSAGGCRVTAITPDGPAAAAGLAVGDVIVKVARRSILNSRSLKLARRRCRPGVPVAVTVRRGGEEKVLELVPGKAK